MCPYVQAWPSDGSEDIVLEGRGGGIHTKVMALSPGTYNFLIGEVGLLSSLTILSYPFLLRTLSPPSYPLHSLTLLCYLALLASLFYLSPLPSLALPSLLPFPRSLFSYHQVGVPLEERCYGFAGTTSPLTATITSSGNESSPYVVVFDATTGVVTTSDTGNVPLIGDAANTAPLSPHFTLPLITSQPRLK